MATLKANGGAASVWEQRNGLRLVLCHNGKALVSAGPGCGYYHAHARLQAVLTGKLLTEQEAALAALGFTRNAQSAQVAASTTIAAYWHDNAKQLRRLRKRMK